MGEERNYSEQAQWLASYLYTPCVRKLYQVGMASNWTQPRILPVAALQADAGDDGYDLMTEEGVARPFMRVDKSYGKITSYVGVMYDLDAGCVYSVPSGFDQAFPWFHYFTDLQEVVGQLRDCTRQLVTDYRADLESV